VPDDILLHSIWLIFYFIMGACIGSFLNVVVYRLPNDMTVMKPTFSFCPACKHQLEWWENVPVAAWFYLKAKCSHCGVRISFQYPGVELFTGVLFGLLYWWYYMAPGASDVGLGAFGLHHSFLAFVAVLIMVSGLIAGTLIDYRYYVIPTQITWTVALAAIILIPLSVFFAGTPDLGRLLATRVLPNSLEFLFPLIMAFGSQATLERTDLGIISNNIGIGLAAGGLLGLAISSLLIHLKVMPRSFDDYDAFMDARFKEMQEQASAERAAQGISDSGAPVPEPASSDKPAEPVKMTIAAPLPPEEPMDQPDMILSYPFARREMTKEAIFLAIPTVLAILGAFLAVKLAIFDAAHPAHPALLAAAGVGLGYLVGGLSIWLTRILGTLGFGKEAMGLGDVHLMAAMGAVMGPVNILAVYLVAPFLGVGYWLFTLGVRGVTKKSAKIIPYGPFLALAALICMVWLRAPVNSLLSSPNNHPGQQIKALYPSDEDPLQAGSPGASVPQAPGIKHPGFDLKPVVPYQAPSPTPQAPSAAPAESASTVPAQ
jgi:leader peptidase (prepilin peptidase) / N-methyltransferase